MDDEFDDLGPHPDDDGFDTEQIINADDLVNFASNDDFDEGLRELFRLSPPEVTNQPLDPVLGKLALNGLSDKELRNRKIAMRQMADLNLQSGVNVYHAQGEHQPYMARVRSLEDGTVIKSQSLGALSRTIIDTPPNPEEDIPELDRQEEKEPTLDFMPFIWVGVHHKSGGDPRDPEWGGYEADKRYVYPHLVVYEPADAANVDGITHNIVSNRHLFTGQPVLPHVFGSHTEAKANQADLEVDGPTDLYPDGPSVTESSDPDVQDQSKLEVWLNPAIVGDDGDEYNYIDTDFSENAQESEEEYWDVIIRSRRIGETTPVTDRSGAGSVMCRAGRYAVKVMMGGQYWIDSLNLHTTVFDLHIVIGSGTIRYVERFEVTLEAYTGYLSSILPGGWFPRLRSSAAFYQEWADEDWNQPGVLREFLSGSISDETATPVPDRGSNGHGPWWWHGGLFAFMPPPQVNTPVSLFIGPVLAEVNEDEPYRPEVTTYIEQFPKGSIFHPRVDLSPAAAVISTSFARNTIQTVIGVMAFSGDQVKVKTVGAPEGCDGATPPATLVMDHPFDIDPDKIPVYGRITTPPGVYRAVRDNATLTILYGESPGNGIDFWQESSCFGAVKDVRIFVDIDDISPGIQELIDAPLSPLSNPMILYTRGEFSATASNGEDYGDRQRYTTWSNTSTEAGSTEGEWTAAGGPGGYFSAEFALNDYTRVMEVY
jgi:hypothetical protein